MSRRRFIKRSGGATIAAAIAWQATSQFACAVGGGSCTAKVAASPNDPYTESQVAELDSWRGKIEIDCDPTGAPSTKKTLKIRGVGWKFLSSTTYVTQDITVVGEIDSACNFGGSVTPAVPTTYFEPLHYHDDDPVHGTRTQTWYELGLQITDTDANDLEAYANAKVFIKKTVKKNDVVYCVQGSVLSGYPKIEYSLSDKFLNGSVWKV